MTKKVYVETLGCQMNENDSELMLGLLKKEGNYQPTATPDDADLIIVNTCQIRENAEERAFGLANRFNAFKKKRPNVKIAMTGCMVQQVKDGVFEKSPHVDIVVGTQNIKDLPSLVNQVFSDDIQEGPVTHLIAADRQKDYNTYEYFDNVMPVRKSAVSAWVSIIEGCDYFCTYCVVPYTRGRQLSRKPDSILKEVKTLASQGYKEVTLLGQTVDSYGKDFTDEGIKGYGLGELFTQLNNEVPEIKRLRFMTSHPLDLSDKIIDAVANLPNVMEYIHIPMQAGSNQVLDRMKRGYTKEQYFELIDKIRAKVPNVAITGDFIVGFPGETDEQFEETIAAAHRAQFDAVNTAAYSARKQTPAGIWELKGEGQISEEVKKQRLLKLNDELTEIARGINSRYQDQVVEVLVEGYSRRNTGRLMGRTRTNKVVNFDTTTNTNLVGEFVEVKITETQPYSLLGQQV